MLRSILEDHSDPWEQQSQGWSPTSSFPRFLGLFSAWHCLSIELMGVEARGLRLWLSSFPVQHNHLGYFLKIIEPSILKDQHHAGHTQARCLRRMLHLLRLWTEFSICTVHSGALRDFACSLVPWLCTLSWQAGDANSSGLCPHM